MTFKIGDKIRIIEIHPDSGWHAKGRNGEEGKILQTKIGTIINYEWKSSDEDGFYYEVDILFENLIESETPIAFVEQRDCKEHVVAMYGVKFAYAISDAERSVLNTDFVQIIEKCANDGCNNERIRWIELYFKCRKCGTIYG